MLFVHFQVICQCKFLYAYQWGDGHLILNLETIGAWLDNRQALIDRQIEGVAAVLQLRLPLAVSILQIKLVSLATVWLVVLVENGENHRKPIVWIVLGEADLHAQIERRHFFDNHLIFHCIEAFPNTFIEHTMKHFGIIVLMPVFSFLLLKNRANIQKKMNPAYEWDCFSTK